MSENEARPHEAAEGEEQLRRVVAECEARLTEYAPASIPANGKWTRIPGFAMRFGPSGGRETIKVIATLEPADFRGLLYLSPDTNGRDLAQTLPRGSRGLGQLLNHARRGTKDPDPVELGPDWATAEAAFEVVEPPKK